MRQNNEKCKIDNKNKQYRSVHFRKSITRLDKITWVTVTKSCGSKNHFYSGSQHATTRLSQHFTAFQQRSTRSTWSTASPSFWECVEDWEVRCEGVLFLLWGETGHTSTRPRSLAAPDPPVLRCPLSLMNNPQTSQNLTENPASGEHCAFAWS